MDSVEERFSKLEREFKELDNYLTVAQVEAWEKLKRLNSHKETLALISDRIKINNLSRIEELEYLGEVIEEIENNQASAKEKFIKELTTAKEGLENKCQDLVKRTEELNALLEDSEAQTQALEEALKAKGTPDAEIHKIVADKERIRLQEERINKLTVQVHNLQRSLDACCRKNSLETSKLSVLAAKLAETGIQTDTVIDLVNSTIIQDLTNMPSLTDLMKSVTKLIPYFSGADSPDLRGEVYKFVAGCDLVMQAHSEATAEEIQQIISCIKQRLVGAAYEHIAGKTFNTVKELGDLIKSTYLKRRTLEHLRSDISNCKQGPTEPVSFYGRRLETLLTEAETIINTQYGSDSASLTKEFKKFAAISFIKGLKNKTLMHQFVGSENEPLSKLVTIVEKANDLFDEHSPTINLAQEQTPALKCAFCDKIGHGWVNCPVRLNTPYCVKCGIYNHEIGPLCNRPNSPKTWGNESPTHSPQRQFNGNSFRRQQQPPNFQNANQTYTRAPQSQPSRPNSPFAPNNQFQNSNRHQNRKTQPRQNSPQPNQNNRNAQNFSGNRNPFRNNQIDQQNQFRQGQENPNQIRCYQCNRFGHISRNCDSKPNPRQGNSNRPSQRR